MKNLSKEDIITYLGMIPLDIEGGMWKPMFRSDETVPEGVFQGREGDRDAYGSILYLLTPESVSRMHRLVTDEIWHFYMGDPCELLVLLPDGTGYTEILGDDILSGEKPTVMVPRGYWQGTRLLSRAAAGNQGTEVCGWALLGTTMTPAYEDADYEDGTEELLSEYPDFATVISDLLARP